MILAQKTSPNPQRTGALRAPKPSFSEDSNDLGPEDVPKPLRNRRASRAETFISLRISNYFGSEYVPKHLQKRRNDALRAPQPSFPKGFQCSLGKWLEGVQTYSSGQAPPVFFT